MCALDMIGSRFVGYGRSHSLDDDALRNAWTAMREGAAAGEGATQLEGAPGVPMH